VAVAEPATAADAPEADRPSPTPPVNDQRPARSLKVAIVAANQMQFDSRLLHTAMSLAEDGHTVTMLGWSGPGLPTEEAPAPGVRLIRLEVDRRIVTALRPLPRGVQRAVAAVIGLDPEAMLLPPDAPRGLDRLRHPVRRLLEVVANARRVGPWSDAAARAAPRTDVFHAKSLVALPVARASAKRTGGRFVYDVADYHTEAARLARMPWVVRELVRRRERDWVRDAAGVTAVSDPVADLVAGRWGVTRPTVLLNCPPAWRPDEPSPPVTTRLREALKAGSRPIVLYQGGFSVDRGVEELVAAADEPALRELGAVIAFLGFGRLKGYLEDAARTAPDRIHVLEAVPPDELLSWTAGADVSFVGQPPRTLNQRMNLPNKLFESLMAGVPVVVSQGNEQCRLVEAEQVGLCANIDDPADVARALASLLTQPDEERARLRAHCRTLALRKYTWERNVGPMLALYRGLATAPSS
jgi:glycosyltransferase involved in cell wall biosynthesis